MFVRWGKQECLICHAKNNYCLPSQQESCSTWRLKAQMSSWRLHYLCRSRGLVLPRWTFPRPPRVNLSTSSPSGPGSPPLPWTCPGVAPSHYQGAAPSLASCLGPCCQCAVCCAPLVNGDIILPQSINFLWLNSSARCPLFLICSHPLLSHLSYGCYFHLEGRRDVARGPQPYTPQTNFQDSCGCLCSSWNIPVVGISSQKPLH